ncbi:MAG TPA: DUF1080 domain-containing protein [Blastocatellia bacterium]|nr:DUF1080 domain-containing protein [Blastocatellia bacterium]
MPRRQKLVLAAIALGLLACGVHVRASQQSEPPAIIGRWDITVNAPERTYPSWLEVRKSGYRTLVGRYVGRSGSARPISKIEFADGQLRFSIPVQWERRDTEIIFEGKLEGDRLTGWTTDEAGNRLNWTAERAPTLRRPTEPKWGNPMRLLNGTDLKGWHHAEGDNQWKMVKGVLTNVKAGGNLVTDQTFNDFKLHAEFRYPKGGNSGIYLRGRYEVQIEDSAGREPESIHLGGIYGFLAPNEDAAKNAGEWQSFDVTLVGRLVTVVLNGKTIICNQEIPGITGGAIDSNERAPGPLFLQGDHGPVEFRNIILTPAR